MCKGEAHGDFDLRTMPADSNLFNSALAICNFSGSRPQDFAKMGGVATGVDVMLNPMVRCRLHIPGAQNRGKFLQKNFYIIRHGIWDFLNKGGEPKRDMFSLKLKLNTSPRNSGLDMRIWQEAGWKSLQWAVELELEPGLMSS
jgi:hypothetical protein